MNLEHVSLWTRNLEGMKDFYKNYLQGKPGSKYTSEHEFSSLFQSYFLSFDSGTRLEIMQMDGIPDINSQRQESVGLTHLAFLMSNPEEVRLMTQRIKDAGFPVVVEPHQTGDGYFESCILDPDGNRVELVVTPELL